MWSLQKRSASNHFAGHWDTMPPVNVASAMVEGARLRLRRPVSSLRAHVGCFWSIETTPATRLRTLPDACATLSIESGHSKALECFLVGPRRTPAARVPAPGQTLFGVRLKPGVTFVFSGVPVHTLVERSIRLPALLHEVGSRLEKSLAGTRTVDEGIDVLERFLIQRLSEVQIDSRVQVALKRIEECSWQIRIGQLARDCQVSARHLDRLLRIWVGFSPKRLARICGSRPCCSTWKPRLLTAPHEWRQNSAISIRPIWPMRLRCSPARVPDESRRIVWPIFPRHAANELINSP